MPGHSNRSSQPVLEKKGLKKRREGRVCLLGWDSQKQNLRPKFGAQSYWGDLFQLKKKSLREWRGEEAEEDRGRKAANSGSLLPEPGPWCRGRLGAQSYLTLETQLPDFCTPVPVSHWLGPPPGGVGGSNFRIRWAPIGQGLSCRGEINWKATVLASRHG